MAAAWRGSRARTLSKSLRGSLGIGTDPGHPPGDPHDRVVRVAGEQVGEILLGLGPTAEACQGLAARRQDSQVFPAQLDGAGQVGQGGVELVQLQLHECPVDQGLDEVRLQPERAIVGIPGVEQPAGPGEGQAPVEVGPGECRPSGGTHGEIAGRLEESSLGVVAVAQDEPGPEGGDIEAKGLPQGVLGARGIAGGQERGAEERPVVAGRRCGLGGPDPVPLGQVGFAEGGVVSRSLVEERGRGAVAESLGAVEAGDRPLDRLAPVGLGTGLLRLEDACPRLQHDELHRLLPQTSLLIAGQVQDPTG